MKKLLVGLVVVFIVYSMAFGADVNYDQVDIINLGNIQVADTFFFVIGPDTVLIFTDIGTITEISSHDNISGFRMMNTLNMLNNRLSDVSAIFSDSLVRIVPTANLFIIGGTSGNIKIEEPLGTLQWTFSDDTLIGETGAVISGLDHIVFNNGTDNMRQSGLIMWEKEYWFPDLFTDTIPFFEVDSSIYPFGITITNTSILTSVDGVYALQIRQYTAADPPVASNWIDTLNVGSTDQRAASTTFTDATVPRGAFIYINTPDTDVDWIKVKIVFFANES